MVSYHWIIARIPICKQAHAFFMVTAIVMKVRSFSYVEVADTIRDIGSRTNDDDMFIFFYAGHGDNVQSTSHFNRPRPLGELKDDPSTPRSRNFAEQLALKTN